MAVKNGRYEYPEKSWSEGRMMKKGETQLAMMLRRKGEPEFGGTEMDRAAGMGLTARGGPRARAEVTRGEGGLSPDVIQQQKAQTQAPGQQYQIGTKMLKKRKEGDLESLQIYDVIDTVGLPVQAVTGKAPSEWTTKMFEGLFSMKAKYGKDNNLKELMGYDKNFERSAIPIDQWDPAEQASRFMKQFNQKFSVPLGKKSGEEKEE
jgi:hypothetical protein